MMGNRILQRVIYDLFESETDPFESPEPFSHTIDRELCLEFTGGERIYVSWCNAPLQYAVGISEASFFTSGENKRLDLSSHPIWKRMIGQPVEFLVLNEDHQIVELRSPAASIYFATVEDGNWLSDVITISSKMPEIF